LEHPEKLPKLVEKLKQENRFDPDFANYNPTTNVAFEFMHIYSKSQDNPDSLIPLLFRDSRSNSIPLNLSKYLVHDARDDQQYHHLLSDISPVGIIPRIFQIHTQQDAPHSEIYCDLLGSFHSKLSEISSKLELAQLKPSLD